MHPSETRHPEWKLEVFCEKPFLWERNPFLENARLRNSVLNIGKGISLPQSVWLKGDLWERHPCLDNDNPVDAMI